MASQTSAPTVTHLRPAILIFTGAAAALATYLVYRTPYITDRPVSTGLRRRNAIHAHNTTRATSQPAVSFVQHSDSPWPDCIISRHGISVHHPLDKPALDVSGMIHTLNLHGPEADTAIAAIQGIILVKIFEVIKTDPPYEFRRGTFVHHVVSGDLTHGTMSDLLDLFTNTRWHFSPDVFEIACDSFIEANRAPFQAQSEPSDDGERSIQDTESAASDPDPDSAYVSDPLSTGTSDTHDSLHELLYNIAEDEALNKSHIHRGTTCDSCQTTPITGIRWHCINCPDLDLCSACEAMGEHIQTHVFAKVKIPICTLAQPRITLKPWYPGQLSEFPLPLGDYERATLADTYDVEDGRVRAYYDRFLYLASEINGPSGSKSLGIDRNAFRKALTSETADRPLQPSFLFDRMFAFYNVSGTGYINLEEFVSAMSYLTLPQPKTNLLRVFNGYDADGDGFICRADMIRMLRAKYSKHQAQIMEIITFDGQELGATDVQRPLHPIDRSQYLRSHQPISALFPHPEAIRGERRFPSTKTIDAHGDPQLWPDDTHSRPVLPDGETKMDVDFWNAITGRYHRSDRVGEGNRRSNSRLLSDQMVGEEYIGQESLAVGPTAISPATFMVRADGRNARPLTTDPHEMTVEWKDDIAQHALKEGERPKESTTEVEDVSELGKAYPIPEEEVYLGESVLYQVTEDAFNELLDPLFRVFEQVADDARKSRWRRRFYRDAIDAFTKKQNEAATVSEHMVQEGHRDPTVVEGPALQLHRSVRSASPSPEPQQESRHAAPQLSQADIVREIQREAVPTDDASLSIMEEQIRREDVEDLLRSAGFTVDESWAVRDPTLSLPVAHGAGNTASYEAAAADTSTSMTDGVNTAPDASDVVQRQLDTDANDTDVDGEQRLSSEGERAHAVSDVQKAFKAQQDLPQTAETAGESWSESSQGLPGPAEADLKIWAMHDIVDRQTIERGGPGRITVDELEQAVEDDEKGGRRGEGKLRALVENWLEWAIL